MTPNQFYKQKPREVVKAVVSNAKTTFSNFQQIALARGSVGPKLAERLAIASSNEMTEMEILYPERFEDEVSEDGVHIDESLV